jgi:hypothetical protein
MTSAMERTGTRGRPSRTVRPETIELNDDTLIRNDVLARQDGVNPRTLDRGDAHGAPYVILYGTKYRPLKRYREHQASQIRQAKRRGR